MTMIYKYVADDGNVVYKMYILFNTINESFVIQIFT